MLFRDQCVAKGSMIPMVETDTTITFQGYKVEVNGTPVTELRIFRNKTAQQYYIGIDNCLEFNWDVINAVENAKANNSFFTSYPSATINAAVRMFNVVVDKVTGVVTETSAGTIPFDNIVDGYYANFAPNVQNANDPVILSCNYQQNGLYHVPKGAIALLTTYGNVKISSYVSTGYTVWNLTSIMGSLESNIFRLYNNNDQSTMLQFTITRTELKDGSNNNINGGRVEGSSRSSGSSNVATNTYNICPSQKAWSDLFQDENGPIDTGGGSGGGVGSAANTGSVYFSSIYNNIFFENIRGGLESVAAINVTNVSASANRERVILERKIWQPSSADTVGSPVPDMNPSVSTINPKLYKFSKHYGRASGFISKQYEFFTATIDDLFLNSMATCRRAFVLGGGTPVVDSMMQGYIDSVSATHEEFQDGYKAWRVSFSFTQEIGLEN